MSMRLYGLHIRPAVGQRYPFERLAATLCIVPLWRVGFASADVAAHTMSITSTLAAVAPAATEHNLRLYLT